MKKIVTTYDMMISSPSDTKDEVEAVFESVADFNRHSDSAVMIRILRWNKDVFMNSSKSPQESINEQIVEKCDFAVAIFKQRLGKRVGDDESGTAQEIRLFREKNKQVFVFCWAESLRSKDGKKTPLQKYIGRLKRENVWVKEYTNADNLRSEVWNQLKQINLLQNVPDLEMVNDFGICAIGDGKANDRKLKVKIENAKHVKVFQTTGSNFFKGHVTQLSKMLRNGGTLQVLLPNPESEFLHDVDLVEGRSANNSISQEFSQTIDYIREIWKNATANFCNTAGKILIGCARTMLRQTEIICIDKDNESDKNDKQIWCWVTVTMPPKRAAANSLSIECQTIEQGDGSLADLTNTNFNRCWEESKKANLVFRFTGQPFPYFYKEAPHAIMLWKELADIAMNSISTARIDPERNGVLIEVAAQHPLKSDGTPGEEFSRRLDMGIELYHKMKNVNKRCGIYVPGSLHMYEGVKDILSLSEAGRRYLLKRNIPEKDIYGEPENTKYRNGDGVYNSADECFVATQIWKNEGYSELFCVCSPLQCMRKTTHYIAFGVFPSVFTCPVPEMFHSYVGEVFEALPYVLYKDPYFQPRESKRAIEQRAARKPDFAKTKGISGKTRK